MQGQSDCIGCPEGFQCTSNGTTEPVPCERGYYCEAADETSYSVASLVDASNDGSIVDKRQECPAGTYGIRNYATREDQCASCPAGYYCEGTGLTAYTGECDAGYFCAGGDESATPGAATASIDGGESGLCPTGRYCPAGTTYPIPCPTGTYQDETGPYP